MTRDEIGLASVRLVKTAFALACMIACSTAYEGPPCPSHRGSAEVTGDPTICPKIGAYSVSPTETQVGQVITLTASGVSETGDPLTLTWSASSGTVDAPVSVPVTDGGTVNTTYRCASPGTVTLTLTVSNGHCGESIDVSVECLN